MTTTASNIVVGAPSSVIVSAYDVVEGSGVDLGATEGGVKISYEPEFYEKEADQYLGPVGVVKTKERMKIEMVLAESSLANLAYAFGYPTTAVSGQTLSIGGNATVTERTLYINSNAVSGGSAKWTFHKVVVIGATEVSLLKKDKTALKVTFTVLQDTSKSANQQFYSVVYSSTDTTPPTVAMTSPAEDGTVAAGGTGALTLTFTESANAIDEGTLVYGNADKATVFVNNVEDPANTSLVAGSISYNAATKILTFTPDSVWATAGNNYQIIITTSVRDTAGNYLANTFFGHFVSA